MLRTNLYIQNFLMIELTKHLGNKLIVSTFII